MIDHKLFIFNTITNFLLQQKSPKKAEKLKMKKEKTNKIFHKKKFDFLIKEFCILFITI